jgi:hypothetical protein
MRRLFRHILVSTGLGFYLAAPSFATDANDSNHTKTGSTIDTLTLKVGEAFVKARSRIVRLGWKPVHMHRNDGYEYSGVETELAERGFIEIESCSIDAGVLCIFHYTNGSGCLRLDTKGEQIRYMSVTSWTNECPESS